MSDDDRYYAGLADSFLVFRRQLSRESDRGAVIVASALLDDALQGVLQARLRPSLHRDDELFEGAYAPLSSFSAKIDMAYRVGLIGDTLLRGFHIVRKLRNEFAHSANEIGFSDSRVQDRLRELFRINQALLTALWEDIQDMDNPTIKEAVGKAISGSPSEALFSILDCRTVFEMLFALIAASLSLLSKRLESLKLIDHPV